MRAPRRRHGRMSPRPPPHASNARTSNRRTVSRVPNPTPRPTSASTPPRRLPPSAAVASMPTEATTNNSSVPNTEATGHRVTGVRGGPRVTSKPLEEPAALAPSSPLPNNVGGSPQQHPTAANPTVRPGTKRPRAATTRMCRRGSSDAGADGVRAVVACAPVKPAATVAAASVASARTLAVAAAGHIGFNGIPGHNGVDDDDAARTLRVRVQRLLVQFVMLPVVWVSLCCVLTAAMGIGAVESLQRALVHDSDGHSGHQDDEEARRPAKKTKREALDAPGRRPQPRVDDDDDARGLVFKRKTRPDATTVDREVPSLTPSTPSTPPGPRPRRVLIWDLDETLVLFASLYSGQFARTSGADLATSVALGEQMMKYLLAVLERHFFFSDLHDADIDHISCVAETASHSQDDDAASRVQLLADRYARIRAIYERHDDGGAVDFLNDPTSPWFSARQALVTSIDMLSAGWLREVRELLALTAQQTAVGSEEIVNVLVTNTQLSPALCKCLIYGLDAHFPIESVYSSSKLHKLRCFETIRAKYGGDGDVEFIGIGDGAEEEQVSHALGMAFVKIRSIDDVRRLRHELQLAPLSSPTTKNDPQPVTATTTTRVASPPSACAAATAANE